MYKYNLKDNRPYIAEIDDGKIEESDILTVEGEEYEQLMSTIRQGGYEIGLVDGKIVPVPIKKYSEEFYQQQQVNSEAQTYLQKTDWIDNKYVDLVIISGTMTQAQFQEKYSEILTKRQEARDAIKPNIPT